MNNKILVNVYSPEFGETYEIFIPINEYISVVIKLITNVISGITGVDSFSERKCSLINKKTLQVYSNKVIVRDTDMKNSTDLILL